jgi:hypothetical protein
VTDQLFLVRLRHEYVERDDDRHLQSPSLVKAFDSAVAARDYLDALDARSVCPPPPISALGAFAQLAPEVGHGAFYAWLRSADGSVQERFVSSIAQLCSLGEEGFRERVRSVGLALPQALPGTKGQPYIPWHVWWREVVGKSTEAQRLPLWAALDRVSYFEVTTVPCEL